MDARATTAQDLLQVLHEGRPVRPVRGNRSADLDGRRVLAWWTGFRDQVLARRGELDGVAGALVETVLAADAEVAGQPPGASPAQVFEAVARGVSRTRGPLQPLSAWFEDLARVCSGDVGTHELALAAGHVGVAGEDGGEPVLQAMAPAAQALAGADAAGVPAVTALTAAYRAAADGARGTVHEGSVDPVALTVAWFFERGTVV
ncbi:hypothetical protein [Kineococcus sp. SYSU DK018]|uniref:hypothetical protein n=1 Tax=Kineococcus sp. SYSU DK018 TaxID=3383139 RepID=UPI003D7D98DA